MNHSKINLMLLVVLFGCNKGGDCMGIGASMVMWAVAGFMVVAVITIAYLSRKKLKEIIRKRKEKNKKSKVAFGYTRKIVKKNAREILEKAPSMTMEDLERTCEEIPYFVADYDSNTDEVSNYTAIKTDSIDKNIENIIRQSNDGIFLVD